MKKLMSTLQRWGVFGLSVLGGHGATASPAHLSDEALSQLNLDNLPNIRPLALAASSFPFAFHCAPMSDVPCCCGAEVRLVRLSGDFHWSSGFTRLSLASHR